MTRNCYTPKHRFYVEWFNVWKDPYDGGIREERMFDDMVFAYDEVDACCRMADKWSEGYGFEARRFG